MEFIVGTILAVVPIVVEAYDRYWDLSNGLSTFRQYSQELKKLDTILDTQKTLFRGNVIKLLTAVTNNPEKARGLLSGKAAWDQLTFAPVYHNRVESLHETFTSWKATLEQVHAALKSICLEVEGFRTSSCTGTGKTPSRELLKQLPKRFKLSWKKTEVQNAINELRDFTRDFNELTRRIISDLKEINTSHKSSNEASTRGKASQPSSLGKYREIRAASYRLYNTFAIRLSCVRHQKHEASISFRDDGGPKKNSQGIKFMVAISSQETESYQEPPIWLEIESVETNMQGTPPKLHEPPTAIEQTWSSTIDTLTKHSQPLALETAERISQKLEKPPKTVCFQTTTLSATQTKSPDDKVVKREGIPANQEPQLLDLDMIEDLCLHFQGTSAVCTHTCIGYIKGPGIHRFYLPPPERYLSGQQKTLAEIISWISEDETSRSLPRVVMAHLASSLACAVLQYHSTPWLPATWQSSHVRFFGINELTQDTSRLSFTSPYFRVEFSKPDRADGESLDVSRYALPSPSKHPESSTSSLSVVAVTSTTATVAATTISTSPSEFTSSYTARNELLFRFGIMLLELGYCQPWSRLRRLELNTLPPAHRSDYNVAVELTRTVHLHNRVGQRYTRIVRKCLGCDFGLGESNLENEELQGMFLVDVVGALQETERGLRELEARLAGMGV